eukprot:g15119.t1
MKKPSEDPPTSSPCFLQQLASPSDLTLQFAYSAKAHIRDRETWLSLTDQVLAVGLQHFKAAELNVLLTSLAQVRGALLAGVEGRDGVSETSFHSSGSLVRPQIAAMQPKVHRFLFLVAHALRFLVEAKRYDLPSLACCWNAFRLLDYKGSVEVFFPTFNIIARQLRSHPGKSRDLAYMLRYCSHFKVHLLEEQKRRDAPSGAVVRTRKAAASSQHLRRATTSLTKLLLDFCVKKMGSMRVSELQQLCHSACELGGSFQANTARLWDVIGLHFLRNAGEKMDWPSFFQFSVTADRLQRRGPPGGVDLGILHLKPNAFPLGGEAYFRVLEAKVLGERDKLQPTEVCGTLQLLQRYFVTSNALLVSTLADAFYAHWKTTLDDVGNDKGGPRSGARAQKSTHSCSSYSPSQRLVVLRTLLALGTGAASNGNGNATSNGLWHSLLKPAYRKQFLNYFPHAGFSSEDRKGPPDAFEHSPLLQAQLLIVLMRCLHKFVPKYAEESGSGPKTSPTDPLPPRASVQRFSADKNRVAYHSKSGIITTVDDRSSGAAGDDQVEQEENGGEAEAEKRRRKQQARVELLKRRETAVDYRERVIVATRDLAWRAVPTARWRLRRRVVLAQLLEQERDGGAGKRTELESRCDGNKNPTSRSREEKENFALARDIVALLRDDTVLDGEDFAGLRSLLEKNFGLRCMKTRRNAMHEDSHMNNR